MTNAQQTWYAALPQAFSTSEAKDLAPRVTGRTVGGWLRRLVKSGDIVRVSAGQYEKVTESTEAEHLPRVEEVEEHEVTVSGDTASARLITPDLVKNEDELIERSGLDVEKWRVKSMTVKAWGQGQKDADDEPVAIQLWAVSGKFEKREEESRLRSVADGLIARMESHAPKYESITRVYTKGTPHVLKICIADHHIGKYVDPSLTGHTWTIEEALDLHGQVVQHFLSQASALNIERILIYAGNDISHVDNLRGQTTAGTQVGREGDYALQFEAAHVAYVDMIDRCRLIAPVDVQIIPGNHDEQTCFCVGHSLSSWYHRAGEVSVDYSLTPRKYYRYGVNLFGATHGKGTKHTQLPGLMSHEAKEDWARAKYYEYDTGHLHHRKSYRPNQHEEIEGVLVRVNPALCPHDLYHVKAGYVASLRSAVARAYSKEHGYSAEYSYNEL